MNPKGKLLIIGGAEDKGNEELFGNFSKNMEYQRLEILREILTSSRSKKIEIITTGSRVPGEVREVYQKAFHQLHYPDPGFLSIKDKIDAHNPEFLSRIERTSAVFFTGGDQFRLATIIGGTPVADIIRERYFHDKNFLVAGTSAGAMVMSAVMIAEGGKEEALFGRNLKTSSGLGLIQNCIIDTHFIKRGRFSRLALAVILNPDLLGIGLGEDTALIIKNGSNAECRGSGMVVIIDGKNIAQTNVADVTDSDPIFVENLKVHLLVKYCRFSMKTRKLSKPALNPKRLK